MAQAHRINQGQMPELPPKRSGDIASFDRLSRTIGDGSLRLHGDKPARVIRGKRGSDPASGVVKDEPNVYLTEKG